MQNHTLQILAEYAREVLGRQERWDPVLQQCVRCCEELERELEWDHRIADLLDAQAVLAEERGDFLFFLGLQMGLELGGLELQEEVCIDARNGLLFRRRER